MAQKYLAKSRGLAIAIFFLPLLIVAFLTLLSVQQQHLAALGRENLALSQHAATLQSQNEFYRSAYHTTLDDLRKLSQVYGGRQRYDTLAEELRVQEISLVLGKAEAPHLSIKNPLLWQEYA